MIIERLIHFFEPWQTLYSNSKIVPTTTTTLHLLSMLTGGGLAIAADRATLRLSRDDVAERNRHLLEVGDIHRPVVISLVVLFITGVALAAADLETFLKSPVFWVKLGLVGLLLLNGMGLNRTEAGLRAAPSDDVKRGTRLWNRWRRGAVLSVVLWCATLVAGVILVDAA